MNKRNLELSLNNNKELQYIFINNFFIIDVQQFINKYNPAMTVILINKNENYCQETDFFQWSKPNYQFLEFSGEFSEILELAAIYQNLLVFENADIQLISQANLDLFIANDFHQISKLVGNPYFLRASVQHGQELGRTIGFPTANLIANKELTISEGVYFTKVEYNNLVYSGATCVRTFAKKLIVETNILNFDKNIYQQILKVSFIKKIRNNLVIKSLEELKSLIANDLKTIATEEVLYDKNWLSC